MTDYISASAIKDYLTCSMRYCNRRYHKSEGIATPAMLMGSVVHDALEKEWRSEGRALAHAAGCLLKTDI